MIALCLGNCFTLSLLSVCSIHANMLMYALFISSVDDFTESCLYIHMSTPSAEINYPPLNGVIIDVFDCKNFH